MLAQGEIVPITEKLMIGSPYACVMQAGQKVAPDHAPSWRKLAAAPTGSQGSAPKYCVATTILAYMFPNNCFPMITST